MRMLAFAAALLLPFTLPAQEINGYQPKWWKEAVVYQVYPRSFQDSNGDGIGDLNGITSRLDYLQKLGVNVIWLSPHYDSPNADNGYDIRDYRKVMSEFGDNAAFDRMLKGIKQRHMRLIVDLVVNHTSDEHRWFLNSRSSRDSQYRDYYIWRDGKSNNAQPPNNYPSFFSEPAWTLDPRTSQWYLHYFAVKQPDLNWDNPKVRQEVYSIMRFWLDKGVDGFRMDVITLISKQPGLPDLTPEQLKRFPDVYAAGPHRDQYLQEMNHEVLSKYDDMSVGEAAGISLAQTPGIVDERRHELNMIFNFDAVSLAGGDGGTFKKYRLPELKAIYDRHAATLDKHTWDTVFLSNHDNPRVVSTFGDDSTPEFRVRSAKLIETMILTLRGTPFLYQGDELGMTDYPFTGISQYNDIAAKNAYRAQVLTGKVPQAVFLSNLARVSRDNSRTPMQWTSQPGAGFTAAGAKPWLAINPNYQTINAEQEQADPNSILNYTRQAIALHHASKAFTYGDYTDLSPADLHIYAYTRTLGTERYFIALNFSTKPAAYALPNDIKPAEMKLGNLPAKEVGGTVLHLQPWEARVYRY